MFASPHARAALWLGLGVPTIFASHSAAMFALYAAGVITPWSLFALPFAAAFVGYSLVARRAGVLPRAGTRWAAAFVLACLSCWAGMIWAFNTFGT